MKIKNIVGIAGVMAFMLMGGVSSAITTRAAEGIDPDPCPFCGDGTVWRFEEPYDVLVGHRLCIHGFTKGDDLHYEHRALVTYKCIDCEMLDERQVEVWGDYWECEGHND